LFLRRYNPEHVSGLRGVPVDSTFRVGTWVVRPDLNTVFSNGTSVHLEPKVMEVLVCLASRPAEPMGKEEILKTVWRDTFVSDDALTRAISVLRRAFQDDARDPSFIETIPKRGYRLVAKVERAAALTSQANAAPWGNRTRRIPRTGITLVVATASLVLAIFSTESVRSLRWFSGKPASPLIRSIAVLPLKNLSDDPQQDYYAQGMTEELITNLSQLPSLKVISGTSLAMYQHTSKTMPEIARELKVEGIVTGSVQRVDGQVRITAQLIYAPDDKKVWARAYVRSAEGALNLQSEVAGDFTRQIERVLALSQPLERHGTTSPVN